jgi:DNA-directed RNA polymerase subunit M/transcription elongation factor TFIIS
MTYARLDLCEGPECPNCGCCDAEILREPVKVEETASRWWPIGRARCRNCGSEFSFDEIREPETRNSNLEIRNKPEMPKPKIQMPPPLSQQTPPPLEHEEPAIGLPGEEAEAGVPYVCVVCPKCKSKKVRVTSSPLPIRRHICKDCGYRFKSVEE